MAPPEGSKDSEESNSELTMERYELYEARLEVKFYPFAFKRKKG